MPKGKTQNPNSVGYTNALLEEVNDKFQTIMEATQPIPKMQEDINDIKQRVGRMEPVLDAVFEEVGSLRQDVEVIKQAMKLLDRHDERLDVIERRLAAVEQRLR